MESAQTVRTQTSRQNWGEKKEEAASRTDRRNVLMTEDTVPSKVFISPQQIKLATLIKLNQ